MEMFLMVGCISLFALAVTAAAFGASTRLEEPTPAPEREHEPLLTIEPARFFAAGATPPAITRPRVPIEALLLQIENHVRLEQAAAESFLESPTSALLHSKTISTLVQ